MHGGFGDHAIVIQIGHGVLQRVDAVDCVVSLGLGLACLVGSGLRLLVYFGGLGRHLLDTGLRPGIDIFDRVGIFRGQIIELIGFVDQRRGLLTDIILAGASDRSRHACRQ